MAELQLTTAQRQAVERPGGPILVSAAAGSGKTRVLVERLMHRICSPDEECSVDDFLIITFTQKAAAELRTRIAKKLADRLAEDPDNPHLQRQQSRVYRAQISTIHSFCSELIREYAYQLDIPADFRMIEQNDAESLRRQLADALLADSYELIEQDPELKSLVDGLGTGRDDHRIPELLLDVYDTSQCHIFPEQWMEDCLAQLRCEGITDAGETPWGRYLMEDYRSAMRDQQKELELLTEQTARCDALARYLPVLSSTADTLRRLASTVSWDELASMKASKIAYDRMPQTIKDCPEPELQERIKAIRKAAVDDSRERIGVFYASSEEVLKDLSRSAESMSALFSLCREFSRRYAEEKRRQHVLDFNDLEHLALRLLIDSDGVSPSAVAREVSHRYREIMVDEYQDTNMVQDAIFRAVSRDDRNLFMVGDVKQSIYRFRLAEPGIFLGKYAEYPDSNTVGPRDCQKILLSRNFRSEEAILDAANAVFGQCMSKKAGDLDYTEAEALQPDKKESPLPQPLVELHCLSTHCDDDENPEKNRAEAAFAAGRIRKLLDDENTLIRDGETLRRPEPKDIVILLRSPKNTAGFFKSALEAAGIPCATDSGQSILDTVEVESLVNLLRVLDNAHQDIPLTGALLSPIFALSTDELAAARRGRKDMDLFDALCRYAEESPRTAGILETLTRLRADAAELPLHLLLERIQAETRLEDVFSVMEGGDSRLANLRSFYELAAGFSEGGKRSLHAFLAYVDSLKEEDGIPTRPARGNAVSVLSIHKSKGLEFPIVLLCGLSKKFNTKDQSNQILFHRDLGVGSNLYAADLHTRYASAAKHAISVKTREENRSEEMRILYVAMTRPQCMLIMVYCGDNLNTKLNSISQRLCPETARLMAARVNGMGDWILQTAMLRSEAGELHAVGGRPEGVAVSRIPWVIRYYDVSEGVEQPAPTESPVTASDASKKDLHLQSLGFRYAHPEAARIPAKITATQLKGRRLDEEADDGRVRLPSAPSWRAPLLLQEEKPLTPAQKGTAVHQAMQYLDFSRVSSAEEIRAQLEEMVQNAFLTVRQAEAVAPEKLFAVFAGPLGELIRGADRVIREFKFSVLVDASAYFPGGEGEKLLLQGVTDCCLISGDGLTVVDFKTDRIRPGAEAKAAEGYRPQLDAYSLALQRIFGLPVRRKLLYFFATDTLTNVE